MNRTYIHPGDSTLKISAGKISSTAMHAAVVGGKEAAAVALLLDRKADPNVRDSIGALMESLVRARCDARTVSDRAATRGGMRPKRCSATARYARGRGRDQSGKEAGTE